MRRRRSVDGATTASLVVVVRGNVRAVRERRSPLRIAAELPHLFAGRSMEAGVSTPTGSGIVLSDVIVLHTLAGEIVHHVVTADVAVVVPMTGSGSRMIEDRHRVLDGMRAPRRSLTLDLDARVLLSERLGRWRATSRRSRLNTVGEPAWFSTFAKDESALAIANHLVCRDRGISPSGP